MNKPIQILVVDDSALVRQFMTEVIQTQPDMALLAAAPDPIIAMSKMQKQWPDVILLDGCANAYAAAWILRKEYDRTRNIWDAVGAYHSRTPHFRDAYLGRVRKHLIKLSHTGLAGLLPQNSAPRGAGR